MVNITFLTLRNLEVLQITDELLIKVKFQYLVFVIIIIIIVFIYIYSSRTVPQENTK